MEDKSAKKKKPKKSLTGQIKKLREELKDCLRGNQRLWRSNNKLIDKLNLIEKYFPKKYFKISYEINNNNNVKCKFEQIIADFSLKLAIDSLKENKTYPETFQLVDVKILG